MMRLVRTIKISIDNFFDRLYWYGLRRPRFLRYDEDDKKWYQDKRRAWDVLNCAWNGDSDMLDMLDLKVCHIFHNLKRYGHEVWYYVDSPTCLETQDAFDWAFRKLANSAFVKKVEVCCYLFKTDKKEGYVSVYLDKNKNWKLVLDIKTDTYTIFDGEGIRHKANGDSAEEVLHNAIVLANGDVSTAVKEYEQILVENNQSFDIDVEDLKDLPSIVRENARGPRRHLHEIAQVHHMLKRLKTIDEDSFFYDVDSQKKYLEERRDLYHKIADLMANRGLFWWD